MIFDSCSYECEDAMRAKRLAAAFLMGLLVFSLVGCRLLPQIISDDQKTTDESTGNTTQTEKSTDVTSRLVGTWEKNAEADTIPFNLKPTKQVQ